MTLNGVWCAYKDSWNGENSIITYDEPLHSSTNMNDPGIGIDLQSGSLLVLFPTLLQYSPRQVQSSSRWCVAGLIQLDI